MTRTLTFEIHLQTDYHIGAGGPDAQVDSALFRDADGVPAMRGTELAGLLRDGLRQLVASRALPAHPPRCQASGLTAADGAPRYCGQFAPEPDPCLVCRAFGSPGRAKPWVISSARPVGLQAPLEVLVSGWGARPTQRVRIDPLTRRAEARKLFSREEGSSDLVFRFDLTRLEPDPEEIAEAALIVAAARLVRNLGAGRRRGRGECCLHLVAVDGKPVDQNDWLDVFQQHWLEGKTPQVMLANQAPHDRPALDENTSLRLRLVWRADEPLLAARRAQSANQFESLNYVPGQAVRGAFAALAAPNLQPGDAVARQAFEQLFFSGQVRFSPLYPADYLGEGLLKPLIPTPLDFQTCARHSDFNADGVGVLWQIGQPEPGQNCSHCQSLGEATRLKPLGGMIRLDRSARQAGPRRRSEMHNHLSPETGRVADSDLFGYDALAGQQYFYGELLFDSLQVLQTFLEMTGLPEPKGDAFSLRLGKATRRGYGGGLAALTQPPKADSPSLWVGRRFEKRLTDPHAPLTLILLSDTILIDLWGRFYRGFEPAWLEQELGQPVVVENQFVRTGPIDGFNAHLGLPRWRDLALSAGSSALIRPADGCGWDLAALQRVELRGLGLRRNEGMGIVAFAHPVYLDDGALRNVTCELPASLRPAMSTRLSGQAGYELAAHQFKRLWEGRLDPAQLSQCGKDKFRVVARLLRQEQRRPYDVLSAHLAAFGSRAERGITLPEKSPSWFQQKRKGLEGIQQIQAALSDLNILLESDQFVPYREALFALGVDMLAEQVSTLAREEE